jgi:DNA-binding NarL/FixJ family response regulator
MTWKLQRGARMRRFVGKVQIDQTVDQRTNGSICAGDLPTIAMVYDKAGLLPEPELRPRAIQIVERLQFVRGCLSLWLQSAAIEFEVIGAREDECFDEPLAERVAVVVVTGRTLMHSAEWFEGELAWLGVRRRLVPVVAVVPDEMVDIAEDWIPRFGISGLILMSTSTDVASAVLRLVIAGGTHFPRSQGLGRSSGGTVSQDRSALPGNCTASKLTVRERAVIHYLGQGYPNKIIAHELKMSLSTVKAHMHSIIQKLNVKNRTEVAIAVRGMQLGTLTSEH